MNRNIKIIKRAVRDLTQAERETKVSVCAYEKASVDSCRQMARTIEEWVKVRRQKASEELSLARSFKTALS